MQSRVLKTYFSTPLSGSAREAELRIRNICQGQKKRPAAILMMLAVLLIVLCGSFVAFRPAAAEPVIAMQLQHYDQMGNYIEIPMLRADSGQLSADAQAINTQLAALAQEYRDYLSQLDGTKTGYRRCLFYPSTTGRYLNLIFHHIDSSGENYNRISTWVYDRREHRLVTVEEALELAGVSQDEVFSALPDLSPQEQFTSQEISGFRIASDGQVDFYLRVMYRYTSSSPGNEYPTLYLWSQGECTEYDYPYNAVDYPETNPPLVPAEETDRLSPALWNQWYFAGQDPEGGFSSIYSAMSEEALTHLLFLQGHQWQFGEGADPAPIGSAQLLFSQESEGVTLGAASYTPGSHAGGFGNLVVCLFDTETLELVAGPFARSGDDPDLAVWTGADGCTYLLGTSVYTGSGLSDCSGLLLLRFDGRTLDEVTTLPASAFYSGQPLSESWQQWVLDPDAGDGAAWSDWLAAPVTGGADLFRRNPDYHPMTEEGHLLPQWLYQGRLILDPQAQSDAPVVSDEFSLGENFSRIRLGDPTSLTEFAYYQEAETEILEGWEPVYQEGDYWAYHRWEGLTILCYHSGGTVYPYTIESTRPDLFSYRGVKIGDSRDTVRQLYPELYDTDYWGMYPGEDYLWYCGNPDGWGNAILFFFDHDQVSRIVLNNMFD